MKYLSILRDSFHEAVDSKVLYVTAALSCLLFLLLASLSFRPVTMEEELQTVANELNFLMQFQTAQTPGLKIHFAIADFKQTNDADEPWRGDYHFTFVMNISHPELAANFSGELRKMMAQVVRTRFWWLKDVETHEEKSPDDKEFRLAVAGHGTRIENAASWTHEPSILFGALPLTWFRTSLTYAVYWLENWLVGGIGGTVIVLLSIVVTASFIPNMLRKGSVDLLLSKPITRPALLLWKYVGGLTFIFLNTAIAIFGVWLILGLRTGIWTYGVLVTVVLLTFFFAILYAVSTLAAVLTRSTVVAILLTVAAWAAFLIVGLASAWAHPAPQTVQMQFQVRTTDAPKKEQKPQEVEIAPAARPEWLVQTIDALHTVLPRTHDLGSLSTQILSGELLSSEELKVRRFEDSGPGWASTLGVSAAFIAVTLGLSCWWFATRDY